MTYIAQQKNPMFTGFLAIPARLLAEYCYKVCSMPRPPSTRHPLRTVRVRLGMSQEEFGRQFGITKHTIRQIENRNLALPVTLATRIALTYSLDKQQLIEGTDPEHPRLAGTGVEFTPENYERLSAVSPEEMDARITILRFLVVCIMSAADVKHRFRSVVAEILEMLKSKVQQLSLEDEVIRQLSAYGVYSGQPELTRRAYEMLCSPGNLDASIIDKARYLAVQMEVNSHRYSGPAVPYSGPPVPVSKLEEPQKYIEKQLREAQKNASVLRRMAQAQFTRPQGPQFFPADKSPKKPQPQTLRPDRGSGVRKPSGSHHARAAD